MTAPVLDDGVRRGDQGSFRGLFVVIAIAAVLGGGYYWYSHRGPHDQSAAVAAASGASSCSYSGYEISTLVGGKQLVYDCTINGGDVCVTYHGGIASDSTALVRLAFTSTLGSGKPSCLG